MYVYQNISQVRVLKEQLKRSQEVSHSHQQKANDLHQELLRVNNRKKKLEEVAKRKHLLEREKLTLQLQDTNEQLMTRERRISVSFHTHIYMPLFPLMVLYTSTKYLGLCTCT